MSNGNVKGLSTLRGTATLLSLFFVLILSGYVLDFLESELASRQALPRVFGVVDFAVRLFGILLLATTVFVPILQCFWNRMVSPHLNIPKLTYTQTFVIYLLLVLSRFLIRLSP